MVSAVEMIVYRLAFVDFPPLLVVVGPVYTVAAVVYTTMLSFSFLLQTID